MISLGITPKTYESPKEILGTIYKRGQEDFIKRLQEYNAKKAIKFVYKEIETLRKRRSNSLKRNVGADELFDLSFLTVSCQHLLLTLIENGVKGSKSFSKSDFDYFKFHSLFLSSMASQADIAYNTDDVLKLTITSDYKLDIQYNSDELDLLKWKKETLVAQQNEEQQLSSASFYSKSDDFKFINKEFLTQAVEEIDNAFSKDYGIKFKDITTFLDLIYEHGILDRKLKKGIFEIREKELIKLMIQELRLDEKRCRKLLSFISMKPMLNGEKSKLLIPSFRMAEKDRLTISPIVIIPNKLQGNNVLIGKNIAESSYWFWANGITDSFPFELPENSTTKKVKDKIHKSISKKFELMIEDIAVSVFGSECVERNIKDFQKRISPALCSPNSSQYCGEIDLIAIDTQNKTIFVLDAKVNFQRSRMRDFRYQRNNFLKRKKKSYEANLLRKSKYVKSNIDVFLNFFEIEDNPQEWKIKPALVVKKKLFINYTSTANCDIIAYTELEEYLSNQLR